MKKLISSIAFLTLLITSCAKKADYNCTCTSKTTYTADSFTFETTFENVYARHKEADAKESCLNSEENFSNDSLTRVTTCVLTEL